MMNTERLLGLIIAILCVQNAVAQSSVDELNAVLQTELKICIEKEWHDVISFRIKEIDGRSFEANVKLVDSGSYIKEKECIIDTYTPYYIEDGDWQEIDGEYYQKGDIRKIHFYTNSGYGRSGFDFKWYRPDAALGEHESLHGFHILFPDQESAQKFVSISHELQGNVYNSTPWLRTLNEDAYYQGQSSKDLFESILKDFKQYDIKSEQVYHNSEWTRTTGLTIKYKYPNIIISHKDVRATEFNQGNEFKQGTVTISIPVKDARFEFGRGFLGGQDESIMRIYSASGLEISYKGKKDIVEEYSFHASKLICKNLLTKLRVFKKKVLEENYQGQYGYPASSRKSKKNKQTQELSGGKYVQ